MLPHIFVVGDFLHCCIHYVGYMNRELFWVSLDPEGTRCQMRRVRDPCSYERTEEEDSGHVEEDPAQVSWRTPPNSP